MINGQLRSHNRRRLSRRRKGVSTIWLILSGQVFLVFICFAAEIGHLWVARTELENALEAAALAGALEFRQSGSASARMVAIAYAEANTVVGQSLTLDPNMGAGTNGNASNDGEIVLGEVTGADSPFTFDPNSAPVDRFGVRVRKTFTVNSLCQQLFGVSLTNYTVSADVTAENFTGPDTTRLIRIAP